MYLSYFFFFPYLCFSSCSIFGGDSGDSVDEENYYSEEGEEEATEKSAEEEEQSEEEQVGEYGDEEDVYYIDEEDEDILEAEAEEGENIEIEDTSVTGESEKYDSGDSESSDSSFFSDKSALPPPEAAPKKQWISYKKIKSQSYNSAGFLVNAAYIARPGEDIQSISSTIFGSDQVSQLYSINSHLKARSVKVGDKIYYQSPNRPQDSSQLLFYFEDKGIQPSYHQVQAGENIRTVASQLLRHAESWKEIWATNPDLQSKGQLDQPITIKYWPPDAVGGGAEEATLPPPPQQPEVVSGEQQQPPSMEEIQETSPSEPEEEIGEDGETPPPSPPSEVESAMPSPPDSSSEVDKIRNFSQVDMILAGALALGGFDLCFYNY